MDNRSGAQAKIIQNFLGSYASLDKALGSFGYKLKPLLDSALPAFAELSPERAAEILATVRSFEKLLVGAEEGDLDLLKTPKMLEIAMRDMRLTYSKDFVATLEPNDVVDGYNLDNLQIFRNFKFIETCGYSLHDLQLHPWPALFERSQIITNKIIERIHEVVTTGRTVSLEDIPAHYMKERLSQDRQIVKVRLKAMGPIFASAGRPAGVLASSTAEFIDENPDRDELRFI